VASVSSVAVSKKSVQWVAASGNHDFRSQSSLKNPTSQYSSSEQQTLKNLPQQSNDWQLLLPKHVPPGPMPPSLTRLSVELTAGDVAASVVPAEETSNAKVKYFIFW
jgi:hypothetical protein